MAKFYRNGGGGGRHDSGGGSGTDTDERKKPVVSFGPYPTGSAMIEVAVWENTVGEGKEERLVYSVSFTRSYNDGKEWKKTGSVRVQDIPFLIHGLQKAMDWIIEQNQRR